MYIFYVCVLAPLLVNGFSLIEEEADLNSLSNYEAVNENVDFDSWESSEEVGVVDFESISSTQLEAICKNSNESVYISEEQITIDCNSFNRGENPLESTQNRIKREDNDFEGSGDQIDETPTQETANEVKEEKTPISTPEAASSPPTVKENVETTPKSKETTISNGADKTDATTVSIKTEAVTTTSQNINTEEASEAPETSTFEDTKSPEVVETTTAGPIKNGVEVQKPSDTEKEKTEQEQVTDEKTKIPKSHKGKSLLPKEVESTDIKTDESTQTAKTAGSKDTTILIVLFVAVVVVGALAFGYNFIKKRRQQSRDLETVERSAVTKRSLPNLTKLENGPEKEPLMDGNQVEMVDMRKNKTSEEETQEPTVKT